MREPTKLLPLLFLLACAPCCAQQQPSGGILSLRVTAHGAESDTVRLSFQFCCWDAPASLLANPDLTMDIEYWRNGTRLKAVRFDACQSLLTDLVPNPTPEHLYGAEWTLRIPYRDWVAFHAPIPPPSNPPTAPPVYTVKYRYVGMGRTTSYYRGNVQATSTATPYPGAWYTL